MAFTDFKGRAKALDDIDIPKIGSLIGVGEDEVHAFMDVEAGGSAWDSQGRPKMLFEPHVFWRELGDTKARRQAAAEGLAYAKWGAHPYPRDSYARLKKAMAINETAALKSASWGLGQIMGANHKMCGFPTVQAMVTAFMDDAEHHLRAMIEFLVMSKLDDDLRAHRWAKVARGYNGPGYAKNKYDVKLAKRFAYWQGVRDTPFDKKAAGKPADAPKPKPAPVVQPEPQPAPAPAPVAPVPGFIVTDEVVRTVQRTLFEKGYTEVGSKDIKTNDFDGKKGKWTDAAILASKSENKFEPIDAEITEAYLAALPTFPMRKYSDGRDKVTSGEVAATKPEARLNWWGKIMGYVTSAGAGVVGVVVGPLQYLGVAKETIDGLKEYAADIPGEYYLAGVVALTLGYALLNKFALSATTEAVKNGERR